MTRRVREGSPEVVFGIHPVQEALESARRHVDHIVVAREARGRNLGRLLREARRAGIPVRHIPRDALTRRLPKGVTHQGVAAFVSPFAYSDPGEVCAAAASRTSCILLILDGIEDPRNLGAILRTAVAAGVGGVLLGGEGTVGITPSAAKSSAGAAERIAVAREGRLAARIDSLERAGFLLVGLDPRGETSWDSMDLRGRVVLIVGGEARGLRPGLRTVCHRRVAIPMATGVGSLNVSVAVGVVLFEAVRQRRMEGSP